MMVQQVANTKLWRLFGAIALLWMASQILPVTRLVFSPQQVSVENGVVTLIRSFPADNLGLPRPRISYVETVRPMTQSHNDGHPCEMRGGPFRYDRADPVGIWRIANWATPCLSDPVGYVWHATWTWHVGVIRLGPVSMTEPFFVNDRG